MISCKKTSLETYKITNNHEHAKIVLEYGANENSGYKGEIIVSGSYGTFSYYFSNAGIPFKQFLIGLNESYLRTKFLGTKAYEFDVDKTFETAEKYIKENEDLSEKTKEAFIDFIQSFSCSNADEFVYEMRNFQDNFYDSDDKGLEDLSFEDCIATKPIEFFSYFWKEIWSVFVEELKKETK